MSTHRPAWAAAAIAAGLIVSVGVAELVLRFLRHDLVAQLTMDHQPCLYVRDEGIGYRFRANASDRVLRTLEIDNLVRTNSDGFHDVDRMQSTSTARTILALGDSFTAAIHVPVSETWTQVVERRLGDAAVVNLGLSGTGTDVHLALLRENVDRFRPDVVLLAFYENDVEDVRRPIRYADCHAGRVLFYFDAAQKDRLVRYAEANRPGAFADALFRGSFTFRLVSHYLHPHDVLLRTNRLGPDDLGEAPPPAEESGNLDAILARFLELGRERSFRFVIVPVPTKHSPRGSHDALVAAVSASLFETLEVLDVTGELGRRLETEALTYRDLFWIHDGHLNATGNRLFGETVAGLLP